MDEINWYITSAALVVLLNLVACFKVIKSDYFDSFQKITQVIVIWLFPLVASIGILLFIMNENTPKLPPSAPGGGANDSIGASSGE